MRIKTLIGFILLLSLSTLVVFGLTHRSIYRKSTAYKSFYNKVRYEFFAKKTSAPLLGSYKEDGEEIYAYERMKNFKVNFIKRVNESSLDSIDLSQYEFTRFGKTITDLRISSNYSHEKYDWIAEVEWTIDFQKSKYDGMKLETIKTVKRKELYLWSNVSGNWDGACWALFH